MTKHPKTLHFDIKVTAARFAGEPAARVQWCMTGHLADLLKVQRSCPESDVVIVDPETDLARWSFVVHATSEDQWHSITGRLWNLMMIMGAQLQ